MPGGLAHLSVLLFLAEPCVASPGSGESLSGLIHGAEPSSTSPPRGLQFGKDVIFTYGPLGHLIAFVYTGELFAARIVWEFVSKTVFAAILCGTVMRLPWLWRPFFFFFVLFFIWADPISDALYFLVITCLAAALFRESRFGFSLNAFAGGASCCLCVDQVHLPLAGLLRPSAHRHLLLYAKAPLQYCHHLFYLQPSISSLLEAHRTRVCQSVFLFHFVPGDFFRLQRGDGDSCGQQFDCRGRLAAALLGVVQCGLILFDSRKPATLCIVLFFIGETYLSWNRAFVRADDHVLSFFALCPIALATLWTVERPRPLPRYLGYGINLLIFVICLYGIFLQQPSIITNSITDMTARLTRSWNTVVTLGAKARQLKAQLSEAKIAYTLPRVKAEVGNQTIDVFGYEQGIALLNDLNYTPRPIHQSYSAYTPGLIAANTAFYSSSRAPAYVLLKYQTIDERYPTLDDAGVFRQILLNYTPLFEEKGYTLWRRSGDSRPVQPRSISTTALLFDEVYPLPPGKNLWLELDVQKSFRGQLLSVLYKPPQVEIWVIDSEGHHIVHRLIPSMSSSGFIINPKLETSGEVLGNSARTIRHFSGVILSPHAKGIAPLLSAQGRMSPRLSAGTTRYSSR